MARTSGWSTSALPTVPPEPSTMFSTPLGTPARSKIETTAAPVSGVRVAGLKTTVAADQRGRDLPDRDGDGEVPGRDAGHDTEGLADGVAEVVLQLGGDRLS